MPPADMETRTPFPIDRIFPFSRGGVRYTARTGANLRAYTTISEYDGKTILQVEGDGTHLASGERVVVTLGTCGRGSYEVETIRSFRDNLHSSFLHQEDHPDMWPHTKHAMSALVARSPTPRTTPDTLPPSPAASLPLRVAVWIGTAAVVALACWLAVLTLLHL